MFGYVKIFNTDNSKTDFIHFLKMTIFERNTVIISGSFERVLQFSQLQNITVYAFYIVSRNR